MLELEPNPTVQTDRSNWLKVAEDLGSRFAERAADADECDRFVSENFEDLKTSGLLTAGIPHELGGGGASHAELCEVLRILGQSCGSTALAFAMHTHQVAIAAWRWRHQGAPVDALLRRIATEKLVILSSGGSDWLNSSGCATRVDGGFQINARKVFASGAPAGDLLMTSAIYEDPDTGPTVLHFAVPMQSAGVKIEPTWQVMGMRGTGSHDVLLTDVFIPDAAVSARRKPGQWHMLFHIISMIAFPLVYAVYLGVAEAARNTVVRQMEPRSIDEHSYYLIGGLENELTAARLALDHMIQTAVNGQPGLPTTNQIMIGRTLVAKGVLNTVELAMEATGGQAFYRRFNLERIFRDAQAARYHPLREGAQRKLAGQLALGHAIADALPS